MTPNFDADAPSRPTVCQVLHSLVVGGAEVLATRLARNLCNRFRFVFVCLDERGTLGDELLGEGFPVHVLKRRPGVDWKCAYRMAKLFRAEQVDLIHSHQYTPFFYGAVARLLCRRIPTLFTEHGRTFPDYVRRKRVIANRVLLRAFDRVVGVGEAVRQALVMNEGIPRERVDVIYNGIDLSPFEQLNTAARPGIREELGLRPDDFVIVQVARLDPLKDHGTALRALERVIPQRPNVRLVLIGEGPEQDSIVDFIRQKDLGQSVRLLGRRGDVARLLLAADLFLLSSVTEGIPLTVIEAMAAELPVLCTRVGGVREVIDEEQSGCLVEPKDDKALAEQIISLADDPGKRRRLGQFGRTQALERFAEARMHAEYAKLYRTMLCQ